jgi:hypothetical protein
MTRISDRFLQLGVLAALIGMTMGAIMGGKQDFTLAPAHAHLNLLGWASMMLYGLFYRVFPNAGRGWLAASQFWFSVAGLVVLIPSLAFFLLGNKQATAGVAVGTVLTLLSMVCFAAIVFGATRHKTEAATRAAA